MAYQNIFIDNQAEPPAVYVWDDKKGVISLSLSDFNYAYVKDPKGKFLSMTGERLTKTRRFTRGHPNVFESDLPKETRVLTDLYLNEDTPSEGNIKLFIDIEVSMENGIPDVNDPNNEILSVAIFDPLIDEYDVFVLDKDDKESSYKEEKVNVHHCPTEVSLIHAFISKYEEIQPTIISGWSSNNFDVPYLYNRIRQVSGPATANRLSPIGKIRYSERYDRYKIAGVSCLDYLDLYKKFTYTQLPNYRLDTVGRVELGTGKIEYDGSLDELYKQNLSDFIKYNVQDVRIVVELDKKLQLIELVRGICHIGHVPYEDYFMSSRFLEGTIVTYLHRKGIIVTDKPADAQEKMEALDRGEEGFIGAFVKEPTPGLYDWVYSLDLQSLYPSILMSLNISPETKVGKVLNWDVEKHNKKEIVAYVVEEFATNTSVELEYDSFAEFMEENKLTVSSNGILYSNMRRGVIPEVLEQWFEERQEYKKLVKKYSVEGDKEKAAYYDRRQHIQKIFLNSLYGYLGLPVARFYDTDNAEAVTRSGQDVIKTSAKFVNKKYEKLTGDDKDYCLYIDTDSLYFSVKPLIQDESVNLLKASVQVARDMEKELNRFYDIMAKRMFNCVTHKFYIKGESVASTGLWIAKKRYALDKVYDLESDQPVEKMVVKGLDVVRSSFPKAFREIMTELLKDFLRKVPKDVIDTKILNFKKSLDNRDYLEIARNISANNLSEYFMTVTDGALNTFKKGTPIHIKAAIVYNRLLGYYKVTKKYEKIADGAKIKYVYLKENPLKIDVVAVKGYQDPPQIIELIKKYIDTDKLFENELKNKLDDLYTALKWGNIPTHVNQKANEFFSF